MSNDKIGYYKARQLASELDATPFGKMLIGQVCGLIHEKRTKSWWNSRSAINARNHLGRWSEEFSRALKSEHPEREAPVETEDVFEAAGIAIEHVAKQRKAKASEMKNAASDDAFAKSGGE